MGISFHYSARIREYQQLDELIEEVVDLSKDLNWSYSILIDEKLKGIVVMPGESEPFWLCFTPDGKTSSPVNLRTRDPSDRFFSMVHVKTQYAGADLHLALMKMLRYLSDKYFLEIEVFDETGYWENRNEEALIEMFGKSTRMLDILSRTLEGFQSVPNESVESLAARLERRIREKLGGRNELLDLKE